MIFATFPHQALYQSVRFELVGRGASGGVGLSGATTRVASNSAHWKAEATFRIRGEEAYLALQGFVAQMQGVLGETLVPAWSRVLPWDGQGRALSRTAAVSLPAEGFGDDTGFGQTVIKHASLDVAAALRDGQIRVDYDNTNGLRPGHRIGIGERCHDVMSVVDMGNDKAHVRVQPLMRQAYPGGTYLVLDRPVCRMRFETEGEGILPYTTEFRQSVTVNFREVV
ncbi:hypothetical protein [Loktanella sp. M215]|uniref:hypothetical protein n=1 Tax=Loktanella sp. M215 TaxID=2675431 RepID=UPI001F376EC6|nr:hypothetical protein [Loktanella sp. M215]MCF7700555.1 hypothetical protein [Loktanella sp. M215]